MPLQYIDIYIHASLHTYINTSNTAKSIASVCLFSVHSLKLHYFFPAKLNSWPLQLLQILDLFLCKLLTLGLCSTYWTINCCRAILCKLVGEEDCLMGKRTINCVRALLFKLTWKVDHRVTFYTAMTLAYCIDSLNEWVTLIQVYWLLVVDTYIQQVDTSFWTPPKIP